MLQTVKSFHQVCCPRCLKTSSFFKRITLHQLYCSSPPQPQEDTPTDDSKTSRLPKRLLRRLEKQGKSVDDIQVYHQPDNVLTKDSRDFSKQLQSLVTDATQHAASVPEPEFPSDLQQYRAWKRDQTKWSTRPNVDPKSTSILLFPGQGSQFVGMGKQLLHYPSVEKLYKRASNILGYDLLKLCLLGPKSKLDLTVHCQPAVFVTSIAALERLKEEKPAAIERCIGTTGFSVGEYAALVFAETMSFEDALQIIKIRAEAMQQATEEAPSGMMTVFCKKDTRLNFACLAAREYCKQKLNMVNPVCTVANYLFPECKVIAGNNEALDFIEKSKSDFGIKRLKRISVSGAFHTSLMRPAVAPVRQALRKIALQDPLLSVHTNVTGKKHNLKQLVQVLGEQIYKPVKWEQTMHILYSRPQGDGFPFTYEVGPGKQLGTLLKMVNLSAHAQYSNIEV